VDEGQIIGQCVARHRHQAFIRFLNKINRETPAGRELHLIVDNYATHRHPKVRSWLERHPRFHFHLTPTSAFRLNAVEGFFAELTRQRLKHGVFKGIVDLQAAINRPFGHWKTSTFVAALRCGGLGEPMVLDGSPLSWWRTREGTWPTVRPSILARRLHHKARDQTSNQKMLSGPIPVCGISPSRSPSEGCTPDRIRPKRRRPISQTMSHPVRRVRSRVPLHLLVIR